MVPEGAAVQQPSFLSLNETVSILQSKNRRAYEMLPDLNGSDLRISKIIVLERTVQVLTHYPPIIG